MHLHHDAVVDAPIERVWANALDPATVAAAFPGGRVDGVDGDSFTGQVSVGIGLVRLTYRGQGSYEEVDPARHRAVIRASGGQTRGSGTAQIHITLTLEPVGADRTRAVLDTDLTVAGASLPLMGPLGERIAAPLVATFLRRLGG